MKDKKILETVHTVIRKATEIILTEISRRSVQLMPRNMEGHFTDLCRRGSGKTD